MKTGIKIPEKLFVTGTDTEVGKTVLSAALCSGLKAGYWKPVQAGTEPATDTDRIRKWTALPEDHFYPECYVLETPMSPHEAARREDVNIRMKDFKIPDYSQHHLIVEGAGGILVPLNDKYMIVDLIKKLEIPVLLVARSGLGTINHTLLSLHILRYHGIDIWGVVLNGPKHFSNEEAVRYYGRPDHLFAFPEIETINPEQLTRNFYQTFKENAS